MPNVSITDADKDKVQVLFDALQTTLAAELAKAKYAYADVFMAVHNMHKFTILSMEEQTDDKESVWRLAATTTFEQALKDAPPLKRK